MSRNQNSRFALNPTNIDIPRSTFKRDSEVTTSFDVGSVIPFYIDEVLPGDTFQVKTSIVARLQTLITPMMGNIYLDTYYFFVPNRLLWEHWKEFQGENTQSAWIPQASYTIPQITAPSGGWNVGTIADYLGLPTGVGDISVSALPFRAYALVCDQWFRPEQVSDPLVIPMSDATVAGVNTGTFVTDVAKGGIPYPAKKFADYFVSCLPSPQKGQDVTVGLTGSAPVYGVDNTGMTIQTASGTPIGGFAYNSTNLYFSSIPAPTGNGYANAISKEKASSSNPSTLYADLGAASAVTINELRLAFQIQKLLEKDARGGTRYIEVIKSHFGVTSPDARQQRAEYLGGKRIPLNINQVVQNSSSDVTSPQGNVAGYSLTADSRGSFIKSFTEHGYVLGVMIARYDHSYQQGIDRHWSRKTRYDYYMPVLANIGEQAVLCKEIYAQGSSAVDSDGNPYDEMAFGYQEAWADYRFKLSKITGEMRSAYSASLDVWHLADNYNALPTLSSGWIVEDKSNVDRVLAVTSSLANQIMADIYVQNKTTRPMPLYSIPGLIDHH